MPVPVRFGAYAQVVAAPFSFVGALAVNGNTAAKAVTFPSGTLAGDLALILDVNSAGPPTISGSSGWTTSALSWSSGINVSGLAQKVLVSGDLSGVTANGLSSRTIVIAVYRGASTCSTETTNVGDTDTLEMPGFTKSGGCKGIVSFAQVAAAALPTPPGTMNLRAQADAAAVGSSGADIINPSSYVDGTAISWTGMPEGVQQAGYLCELA